MSDTPKIETASSDQPTPTFTRWEYGDLYLSCSHCGNHENVEKGIKDGLQFVLPTTDEHKLKLQCSKCGVSLMMTFKESDEETKKEAEEKYNKWQAEQEAKKEEATELVDEATEVIEKQDALLQEDTKEESVQDDN